MCEYCEDTKERKDIDDNGEIKVRLNEQMGNNLEINYYHYGAKVGRYIPIAFCPMCGRIVNSDVLKKIKESVNIPKIGVQVGMPVMSEINMPLLEDPCQEIAKAITEAVDPINIANNITKNIMGGGMY